MFVSDFSLDLRSHNFNIFLCYAFKLRQCRLSIALRTKECSIYSKFQ